jgi:hypothetical protein
MINNKIKYQYKMNLEKYKCIKEMILKYKILLNLQYLIKDTLHQFILQ